MRAVRAVGVALLLAVAACGGGDGASPGSTESTVPTPTITGDGSPFCNAMLAVGRVQGAGGASPAEVLQANEDLAGHLDEAQANTPPNAPPDFGALLDDYRLASDAIREAAGDVTKAFAALEAEHPDVVARLGSQTSHGEAYRFLLERCGDGVLPGEG